MAEVQAIGESVCIFLRGDQAFAIDISVVKEAVSEMPLTPMPKVHQAVLGLANLRGDVLPVLNLDELLCTQSTLMLQQAVMLVIEESDRSQFAIVTDRVVGVRTMPVDEEDFADGDDSSGLITRRWMDDEFGVVHYVGVAELSGMLRNRLQRSAVA